MPKIILPTMDTAVRNAREHAKHFNTNAFSIKHLASTLDIKYQDAQRLFYHYILEEDAIGTEQ